MNSLHLNAFIPLKRRHLTRFIFVFVCDPGALHWADWHRKDLDHVRQTAEEHACGIHYTLSHVLCPHLSQSDSRLH